ncbi:MAG: putative translational inhibitor protein [Geoglossum simile]|nr:MAG: putative translational inhibitor protein [Geoglossum simile]
MSLEHINPPGSAPPYKNLYSNVTIVPPGAKLAFVSSQWASGPDGELVEGGSGNYYVQAKQTWINIMAILKALGCGVKDIVHKQVCYVEFNEEIGKSSVAGGLEAVGPEGEDFLKSSLRYAGYGNFHRPDVLISVDVIVMIPN